MNLTVDTADALLNSLAEIRRSQRAMVFLTEYDGVLTPFVPHPTWVRLGSEARRGLTRLATCANLFVGIVSGRSIDDLKELVNVPNLYYVGTGGLEFELDGMRVDHPEASLLYDDIDVWSRTATAATLGYAGTWVERRRLGLTIHFRHLRTEYVQPFRQQIRNAFGQNSRKPVLLEVCDGIEIVPDLGWNRSTAIEMILERVRPAVPIFAGTAAHNRAAVQSTHLHDGVTIGVGMHDLGETDFQVWCSEEFVRVIGHLARKLS